MEKNKKIKKEDEQEDFIKDGEELLTEKEEKELKEKLKYYGYI